MQHSLPNLLRSSLIPELRSDVATGSSCNKQLVLIMISAVWALPNQFTIVTGLNLNLSVISTYFTIVTLGIELRINRVVVDKSHDGQNRFGIVLKVWYLNITDGTTLG